jgi:hypothetical protein
MAGGRELTIKGAAEFRRELSLLSEGGVWEDTTTLNNKEIAQRIISAARLRADTPIERKTIREGGLTQGVSARGAYVQLDNTGRTPFAFGAEHGALQYRQFSTWRGNQWQGWDGNNGNFLQPAIHDVGREVLEIYLKHITKLTDRAFGG